MKRWLKWAVAIAVVVLSGFIILNAFFSSDYVKRQVEAKARDLVGRDVRLERISIGLFGIEAVGLTVPAHPEDPKGHSPLLRIDSIHAQINPVALFYNRMSILRLRLRGALVQVYRDDQGRFSFDDIIQRVQSQVDKTSRHPDSFPRTTIGKKNQATQPPISKEAEKARFDVVIQKMDIDDLTLKLLSAKTGESPAFLSHCSFENVGVEDIQLGGEPFDVLLDGQCHQPGNVRFKASVSVDPAKNTYRVSANLVPFDFVPFLALGPFHEQLRILDGKVGGEIKAHISGKDVISWETDLQGEKLKAEISSPQEKKHSVVLKEWELHSKGQWHPAREAVRIDALRLEVPFGQARLAKPSWWNDSGQDAIHLSLDLTDAEAAAKIAASVLRIPIREPKQRGNFAISLSAVRDRGKEEEFDFEGSANFDSLGLDTFLDLIPEDGWWKEVKGTLGGKVEARFSSKKVLEWKSNLIASDLRTKGWGKAPNDRPLVRLPDVRIQTKGAFDSRTSSAEMTHLEMDLPFARMNLVNTARWNFSGRDEIEAQLHVLDTAELSELISNFTGLPIKGLKKGTQAKLTLTGSRNRKKSRDFSVDVSASFQPLAIGPFAGIVSLPAGVQKVRGEVEGNVSATFSEGQHLRWETDLKGRDARAEVRSSSKEKWRPMTLGHLRVRSKGSYHLPGDSAEVFALDLELPFGGVRLSEKAVWNVSNRDKARFEVNLTDLPAFRRLAGQYTGFSFQEVKKKEILSFRVSAHRDRKRSNQFGFSATSSFLPIEIAPFSRLVPFPERLRNIAGVAGGKLELTLSPKNVVRWNIELRGKSLSADVRPYQVGKWKQARLKRAAIQTAGWFHPDTESGEVKSFIVKFPFGRMELTKKAFWNIDDRDGARISLAIDNLNKVEQWASSIVELPVQLDQKVEKLAALLVAVRSRKEENAFSYHLSTAFDPFEIAPFARLVSPPFFIQDIEGQVAGKMDVSISAAQKVWWNISLHGEAIRAKVRPTEMEGWKRVAPGRVQFDSKGAYELAQNSGRVSLMKIDLPFGKIHLLREAKWNILGKDEIALSWDLPDLENSMAVAAEVASPIFSGLKPKGNGNGTIIFQRDRKLSMDFRARGQGKVHVDSLHFNGYPNLEILGHVSADFKDTTVELSIPLITVRDRSRPYSPPPITLNDFKATISQKELWQGQIAVESAVARSLNAYISINSKNYSNFENLLVSKSRQDEKKKTGAREIIEKSPRKGGAERADRVASLWTPNDKNLSPERSADFLPDIKIKQLEIKQFDYHFKHLVEKNLTPFVKEGKNLNVLIENFDTRMKPHLMETRLKVIGPGQPPRLQLRAKFNPGAIPLPAEGVLILKQEELRPLSPYAYHTRGVEIEGGKADAKGTFSLRGYDLHMKVRAELFGLKIRTTRRKGFVGAVSQAGGDLALALLNKRGGNLKVNFEIGGRVDAPEFNYYEDLTEAMLLSVHGTLLKLPSLTLNLGGKATDVFRNIIEGVLPGSP